MLYFLMKYYGLTLLLMSLIIWLFVHYWNIKKKLKLPFLALISFLFCLLNYSNLVFLRHTFHFGNRSISRGDSELLSFLASLLSVICGHIALVQLRKRNIKGYFRVIVVFSLLFAYPYLIYWLGLGLLFALYVLAN